jgi:hypothetical protein
LCSVVAEDSRARTDVNVRIEWARDPSPNWETCGYLHQHKKVLRLRFSMPVWNLYFVWMWNIACYTWNSM